MEGIGESARLLSSVYDPKITKIHRWLITGFTALHTIQLFSENNRRNHYRQRI